jgi:hypothetical protein
VHHPRGVAISRGVDLPRLARLIRPRLPTAADTAALHDAPCAVGQAPRLPSARRVPRRALRPTPSRPSG